MDSSKEPGDPEKAHHRQGASAYDAFVVRLWWRGDALQIARAELRHVQTDAVVTGAHVAPEWVAVEIRRFLAMHQEP